MNLQSKYLEDVQGNKYAPITTPNAVRWPDGDNLNDKLVQADWNESDSSDPAYIANKPTIPAAQVNADWNASSGVAQILNKPTTATTSADGLMSSTDKTKLDNISMSVVNSTLYLTPLVTS